MPSDTRFTLFHESLLRGTGKLLDRLSYRPHFGHLAVAARPPRPQAATITGRLRSSGLGESRGGISPPRAPKTVREPLDSHGFRCSASDIQEPPMSKEGRIGPAYPGQPISRAFGLSAQALELPARPVDQVVIDTPQSRSQLRSIELAVVVDPAA